MRQRLIDMKKFLVVVLLILLSCYISMAQYNPAIKRLVWAEEFEKDGLVDAKNWSYEEGYVRNKEQQYYTREDKRNVRVKDGCLMLMARKNVPGRRVARKGTRNLSPRLVKGYRYTPERHEYTSGSINTLGKVEFLYGRIEVRAKIPTGLGSWPAIWMLGADIMTQGYPECGEIDIMENVGYEPQRFYGTLHTPGSRRKPDLIRNSGFKDLADAWTDFHVFAIEWYPDRIDFFIDEQKFFTYSKDETLPDHWRFDKPQYLLLNLAYGGSWGGAKGTDDSILPLTFYVDWVRYYK